MIQTPTGKVRRNRRHLTLLPETNSTENGLSDTSSPPLDSLMDDPSDHTSPSPTTTGTMLPGTTVTRSERISKLPDHLNSPVSRKLKYLRNISGLQLNWMTQHPVAVGGLEMYRNLWDSEL